jgi:hypothetical protein
MPLRTPFTWLVETAQTRQRPFRVVMGLVLTFIAFFSALSVHAVDPRGLEDSFFEVDIIEAKAQVKEFSSLTELIQRVLNIVLTFVAIVAAGVLITGGVMLITSVGDEDKAVRAKKLILYAIVGLLIIGAAALVVNVVISIYSSSGGESETQE